MRDLRAEYSRDPFQTAFRRVPNLWEEVFWLKWLNYLTRLPESLFGFFRDLFRPCGCRGAAQRGFLPRFCPKMRSFSGGRSGTIRAV
jgi:hypothetical protein